MTEEHGVPIVQACQAARLSRAAYYRPGIDRVSDVSCVLNNVGIQDPKVHSFFKRLNEHIDRLKNANFYSYDQVQYLGGFLWEIHALNVEQECDCQALRKLHRLPPAMSRNSIDVPTNEPLFRPTSRDIQAMSRRDLTVASASGGGYLRATDNISFIEMLRNRMVVREMGATILSGLVGDVTIPKQTAAATAYWLSDETTAITESQQTFGQLALSPRTVGALTQVSRKLQLQSSPDAIGLVMSDLAKVVAIAVDLAALAWTGTEQPTGIINTGSIGGFTGASLDAAACLNAQSDVAAANALTGSPGYVTTPTVAGLLMARPELPTTGTTRIWQGSLQRGTVFGFPAMSSQQMPAGDMIFGDWSQLVIGEWGVLELQTSESANSGDFSKGISTVRALFSIDVGVRHAGAFSLATSIT